VLCSIHSGEEKCQGRPLPEAFSGVRGGGVLDMLLQDAHEYAFERRRQTSRRLVNDQEHTMLGRNQSQAR
jgi:hypothetical protein